MAEEEEKAPNPRKVKETIFNQFYFTDCPICGSITRHGITETKDTQTIQCTICMDKFEQTKIGSVKYYKKFNELMEKFPEMVNLHG